MYPFHVRYHDPKKYTPLVDTLASLAKLPAKDRYQLDGDYEDGVEKVTKVGTDFVVCDLRRMQRTNLPKCGGAGTPAKSLPIKVEEKLIAESAMLFDAKLGVLAVLQYQGSFSWQKVHTYINFLRQLEPIHLDMIPKKDARDRLKKMKIIREVVFEYAGTAKVPNPDSKASAEVLQVQSEYDAGAVSVRYAVGTSSRKATMKRGIIEWVTGVWNEVKDVPGLKAKTLRVRGTPSSTDKVDEVDLIEEIIKMRFSLTIQRELDFDECRKGMMQAYAEVRSEVAGSLGLTL